MPETVRAVTSVRWLELTTTAPPEYAEPLTHLFSRYADGGVVVEEAGGYSPDEDEAPPREAPVTVRTYLRIDATTDGRRARIDAGLRLISYLHPIPPLEGRVLDQSEWERQEFEAIRVGRRLVVAPAAARWERKPDDVVITLEPGMAFGTGHHPTTRMCMLYLEREVRAGTRFLDVGCGSGILTLAALSLGAVSAVALDTDPGAVKSARANLDANGLLDPVDLTVGSLPSPAASAGEFDIAAANISANALIALAGPLMASLAPDGVVIGSGLLDERRSEVEAAFEAAGAAITDSAVTGDWVAFTAKQTGR